MNKKLILLLLLCAAAVYSCGGNKKKETTAAPAETTKSVTDTTLTSYVDTEADKRAGEMDAATAANMENGDSTQFQSKYILVNYRNKVNGYRVRAIWTPQAILYGDAIGTAIIEFDRDDVNFTVTSDYFFLPASMIDCKTVDGKEYGPIIEVATDEILLDYIKPSINKYITVSTPFIFLDVNFDGKDELLITNCKQSQRDINSFDVYSLSNGVLDKDYKQLKYKEPFRNLDEFVALEYVDKEISCYFSSGALSEYFVYYAKQGENFEPVRNVYRQRYDAPDDAKEKWVELIHGIKNKHEWLISKKFIQRDKNRYHSEDEPNDKTNSESNPESIIYPKDKDKNIDNDLVFITYKNLENAKFQHLNVLWKPMTVLNNKVVGPAILEFDGGNIESNLNITHNYFALPISLFKITKNRNSKITSVKPNKITLSHQDPSGMTSFNGIEKPFFFLYLTKSNEYDYLVLNNYMQGRGGCNKFNFYKVSGGTIFPFEKPERQTFDDGFNVFDESTEIDYQNKQFVYTVTTRANYEEYDVYSWEETPLKLTHKIVRRKENNGKWVKLVTSFDENGVERYESIEMEE